MNDLITGFFNFLSQLILPNWSDLINLVPWVLVAIMLLALAGIAYAWLRTMRRTASRVPRPLAGGAPPAGIHLPGPSRWPFLAPIGAALLLFSLVLAPQDASGHATSPINVQLFALGLVVILVAIGGWLWDAMREWRATDQPHVAQAGGTAAALPAGSSAAVALHPAAGGQVARWGAAAPAAAAEPEYPEPPVGVHLPGPSPWPFFVPIAATVVLYGVIFSAVLIVGGLILAVIAVTGWYLDAGHEYFTTEEVGHAVPRTRDPAKAWPRRLVPVYGAVIAISIAIVLAPIGLGWLNSLTPVAATAKPVTVPAQPTISAKGIKFDTSTLVVPAGRPFDLVFNNNDAGVPHNVAIADSSALGTILFAGDKVTGVTSVTYHVPALQPGSYYFLCQVHPNMNGTVQVVPEAGGGAASPAPGTSPAP